MDNKMTNAAPLPAYLIQRFQGWKAGKFVENNFLYKRLAEEGQHPPAMVISCCDSRVNVTALFEADPGEFFIHRNVANLVPPFSPTGDYHGTSAAIEYAVTSLGVAHSNPCQRWGSVSIEKRAGASAPGTTDAHTC